MTSGSFGTVNLFVPRKATAPFFPSCTGPCHKATPKFALQQFSQPLTAQQKPVAAASSDTAATGKNQALADPRTLYITTGVLRLTLAGLAQCRICGDSASAKHSF